MNREQRRKYEKQLRENGYTADVAKRMANLKKQMASEDAIKEGDKVTLNYKKITSYADYATKTEGYKTFVENNKDTVFTVKYDDFYNKNGNNIIVTLAEDTTKPSWMWVIDDLIKVKKKKVEKNDK